MGQVNVGLLSVQRAAWKLGRCEVAAKAKNTDVPMKCCNLVRSMVQNPACLCAVALAETARKVGVVPQIALDVVKRCGISKRLVGFKVWWSVANVLRTCLLMLVLYCIVL